MTRIAMAYIATALAFIVLDGGWLAVAGPRLYRPELGSLLAEKVRLAPAIVFYLMYVAGLVYFAVLPGATSGWTAAVVPGAVLGVLAYGTYDLTCAATMAHWSTKVTVADMIWGGVASGAAAAAGAAITRALAAKVGG